MRLDVFSHHCRITASGSEVWDTMTKLTLLEEEQKIVAKWLWTIDECVGEWVEFFLADIELPEQCRKIGTYEISAVLRCHKLDKRRTQYLVLKLI